MSKEPKTIAMSASKNSEGKTELRELGTDGVTKVTTFTERSSKHPAGPGISLSSHYERD